APGDVRTPEQARVLARTDLAARVSDIDHASVVLVVDTELVDEAPILDLRVRKAVRRNGTRLVVATSRPSSLDANASATLRFAPGMAEVALGRLAAALGSTRATADPDADGRAAAELLRDAEDVVIVWGERVAHAERGVQGVEALLALATAVGMADKPESGLIEIPAGTNGRGLREVGCSPHLAPGLKDADAVGMTATEMARAEHKALLLVHTDPASDLRERSLWETAMEKAGSVIAFSAFRSEALEAHADVVFPSEAGAEKEGTLTHPDGRLQRLRQALGHPGEVRAAWWVLAELCERAGAGLDADSPPALTDRVAEAVPFYGGVTLDEIAGDGIRWQERGAASSLPTAQPSEDRLEPPPELPDGLRLGVRPSLWAGRETEHSPALRFLAGHSRAELSPSDARRLGIAPGDEVVVSVNGSSVRAAAAVRSSVNDGDVFLVGEQLPGGRVEVTKA
ncbi:MAG: molybdopterin oxidoreductase family protein, partial [Thermoleophilaceae bacterium]